MPYVIEPLWSAGTAGQPTPRARQIRLTNQIAFFAAVATLPYQMFYLAAGAAYYWSVFTANLGFIGCYGAVVALNRAGRFEAARSVLLATVYAQLFIVTLFLSSGAGVHLFYFSLGAVLSLLFARNPEPLLVLLMGLTSVLYLVCHFAMPVGHGLLHVPDTALHVMYVGSATGAILLAGGFAFLFRLEIDRAEQALVRANQELEELSTQDALTGLANRRALDAGLARECARARRQQESIAVLLCDVDSFKAFNDTYGHPAGDACLQQVAEVLLGTARRAGDLVARYGGEEFALVLPATSADAALAIAERVRAETLALGLLHGASAAADVVTISVGVACSMPDEPPDPEALLYRADRALYAAKHGGRNRVELWKAEPWAAGRVVAAV